MTSPAPANDLSTTARDEVLLSLVSGVGPRLRANLIAALGSATAVCNAAASDLARVDGIGPKLANRIAAARHEIDVAAELHVAVHHGLQVVIRGTPEYPQPLETIADPPAVLYRRGTSHPGDALAVAMVGTRHTSSYGLRQAEHLAAGLARAGVTVVSGLARGIDTAAHRAAIDAGGRTVAVIAGGLLQITPPENLSLAQRVAEHGYLLSEAPPRRPPTPGCFPQRNRLISGLSLAVVVVEADDRSGALITARHAAEQNRDVLAVPGPIDSRGSRGCHALIRDGATLVRSVDDVLAELTHLTQPVPLADGTQLRHAAEVSLNEIETLVLRSIDVRPTQVDDLVVKTALPVSRLLATISVLEMRKLVRRVSGTQVQRL